MAPSGCGRRRHATGCRVDRPGPTAGRGHRHTHGQLAPRPVARSDSWRTLELPIQPPVGGLRPAAPGCWRVRSGAASNRRRWYRARSWHAPGWQVGWMSCGAGGPLGRPAFCPASGFDTGSRRPVARHVLGRGSWSAAGKRSRCRRSGLPAVGRRPANYGSRPSGRFAGFAEAAASAGLPARMRAAALSSGPDSTICPAARAASA